MQISKRRKELVWISSKRSKETVFYLAALYQLGSKLFAMYYISILPFTLVFIGLRLPTKVGLLMRTARETVSPPDT